MHAEYQSSGNSFDFEIFERSIKMMDFAHLSWSNKYGTDTDLDWAGSKTKWRSTTRYCTLVSGNLVSWNN